MKRNPASASGAPGPYPAVRALRETAEIVTLLLWIAITEWRHRMTRAPDGVRGVSAGRTL